MELFDIRHSEPHSPANPCSESCTGYAPTQALLKAYKQERRKQARRERDQAKRDLGLKRAPGGAFGGWE